MAEIVIKRPRMTVVLLEDEVLAMLRKNPALWAMGLKRGKHYSRYEKSLERIGKIMLDFCVLSSRDGSISAGIDVVQEDGHCFTPLKSDFKNVDEAKIYVSGIIDGTALECFFRRNQEHFRLVNQAEIKVLKQR